MHAKDLGPRDLGCLCVEMKSETLKKETGMQVQLKVNGKAVAVEAML